MYKFRDTNLGVLVVIKKKLGVLVLARYALSKYSEKPMVDSKSSKQNENRETKVILRDGFHNKQILNTISKL